MPVLAKRNTRKPEETRVRSPGASGGAGGLAAHHARALLNRLPEEGSREAELFEANAQRSPLLRLPAELRTQIYALVLGGRQIHVYYAPWRQRQQQEKQREPRQVTKAVSGGGYRYCVLPPRQNPWDKRPNERAAWSVLDNHDDHDDHDGYGKVGDNTAAATDRNARMTLLSGVCRQLYVETALLPQQLNAWSFQDGRAMERFVRERRLGLAQRRAVRVIFCREGCSPSRQLERRFGNLEIIIVVHKDGKRKKLPALDLCGY